MVCGSSGVFPEHKSRTGQGIEDRFHRPSVPVRNKQSLFEDLQFIIIIVIIIICVSKKEYRPFHRPNDFDLCRL